MQPESADASEGWSFVEPGLTGYESGAIPLAPMGAEVAGVPRQSRFAEDGEPSLLDDVLGAPPAKPPLLVRILRLRRLQPTGWQRALLGDLPIVIAVLLALADLATAWVVVVLPAVVLSMVKFHDVIQTWLDVPPRG